MDDLKVGDIVARKSHGGDVYFRITDILYQEGKDPVYVLRGLLHRLKADSSADDLVKHNIRQVYGSIRRDIYSTKRQATRGWGYPRIPLFGRSRVRSGSVLHIDGDGEFLNTCLQHYAEANIKAVGRKIEESQQPRYIRQLLEQYQPDILVVTGHDGLKKSSGDIYSMDNYRSSGYFVESVREARGYEADSDKLCIFAGACQSYYEAIMQAGANFASSPARILIKALDPALVSEKIALTDEQRIVTPEQIAEATESGSEGVWGINTRGHARV